MTHYEMSLLERASPSLEPRDSSTYKFTAILKSQDQIRQTQTTKGWVLKHIWYKIRRTHKLSNKNRIVSNNIWHKFSTSKINIYSSQHLSINGISLSHLLTMTCLPFYLGTKSHTSFLVNWFSSSCIARIHSNLKEQHQLMWVLQ
jgi:hypothetical protein